MILFISQGKSGEELSMAAFCRAETKHCIRVGTGRSESNVRKFNADSDAAMDDDDDVRHVRRQSVIHYGSLADNASGGVKRKVTKDDDEDGPDVDDDGVSGGNVQRSTEYMALESAQDMAGLGKEEMLQVWLPDGSNQSSRLHMFGPSGLKDYGSATLRCKI